ncbi:MAG: hypothetical protein ACYCOR_18370 [Acidobacteriaceae bacterium]
MELLNVCKKMAVGAVAGVALITALPVFGTVGAITATGTIVGSLLGAAAGAYDAANTG